MRFTADLHLDPLNGNNLLCWIPTNDTLKIRFFLKLLPFSCLFKLFSCTECEVCKCFSFAATIRISTYMWWCLCSVPVNWSRFRMTSHPRQVTTSRKKCIFWVYLCAHGSNITVLCSACNFKLELKITGDPSDVLFLILVWRSVRTVFHIGWCWYAGFRL